jgi:uncharacterized protein YbbK (DUF523 family)
MILVSACLCGQPYPYEMATPGKSNRVQAGICRYSRVTVALFMANGIDGEEIP